MNVLSSLARSSRDFVPLQMHAVYANGQPPRQRRVLPGLALLMGASLGPCAAAAQTAAHEVDDAQDLSAVVVRAKRLDTSTEGKAAYAVDRIAVGGKLPVPVLEVPQSISVVTRQRIEDQNLVTADSALREVPGITVTPWDGASSQIRSRGYNLEVSFDGIPAYGALSQFQQFDLAIYDRVEVLRGPGGIFQGSGQPGGVANFVRRRGRDDFGGSLVLSAGSWSNYRGEVELGGRLTADGRLRSRLVVSSQERDYFYDRAESSKQLFYGTLDYDLGPDTTLSLSATRQQDEVMPYMGQPAYTDGRFLDAPRSTYVYPDWVIHDWDKSALSLDLEHAFASDWSLKARVARQTLDWYFKDSHPDPGEGVDPATGLVASYARRAFVNDQTRDAADVFVGGPFRLWGREHHAMAGASFERYRSVTRRGRGVEAFDVPFDNPDVVENIDIPYTTGYHAITRQNGLYGQLRLALSDRVTGTVGGRWSDFSEKNRTVAPQPVSAWNQGARADGEFTPYAALAVRVTDTTAVYGSYADIFIPQTARKANGDALDPRVGKQFELGARAALRDGRLNLSASVFQIRDVNRAYSDPANPGFYLQAGEVEVRGWEVEASGSPFDGLDLTAGYTRLDTRYRTDPWRSDGEAFSLFEPRHALKLFANYRFASSALRKLSAGGGVHASSGTVGSGVPGLREQGGYAVAAVHVGYRFAPTLRATLAVNNLFDRRYYERVGGINTYNMPGEPRNVMLSLRHTF